MKLVDNRTAKALFKVVPVLIILGLIIQFSWVYASNDTSEIINESGIAAISGEIINSDSIVIVNETVEDMTADKSIKIMLNYGDTQYYDEDNDGVETNNGVIDLAVSAEFNWEASEENLCTRWNILSLDTENLTVVCYGAENCCNFVDLVPLRDNWNEAFYSIYGQYGATNKNTISAQVIYVDYNISLDDPYSDIHYSELEGLSAEYTEESVTEIITKIINLLVDTIFPTRGTTVKIGATLTSDDEPVPFKELGLYANGSLIDIELTNISGDVLFEWDTTPVVPGDYLLNISFPGQTTITNQETINYVSSFDFTSITILPEDGNQTTSNLLGLTQSNVWL